MDDPDRVRELTMPRRGWPQSWRAPPWHWARGQTTSAWVRSSYAPAFCTLHPGRAVCWGCWLAVGLRRAWPRHPSGERECQGIQVLQVRRRHAAVTRSPTIHTERSQRPSGQRLRTGRLRGLRTQLCAQSATRRAGSLAGTAAPPWMTLRVTEPPASRGKSSPSRPMRPAHCTPG